MSDNNNNDNNGDDNNNHGRDEYVGYGSPPKSNRFVKGKSGNSKGRPPRPISASVGMISGAKFDRMFEEEMSRKVTVREGEKSERLEIERAGLRAMGIKMAKGDKQAFRVLAEQRAAVDKRNQVKWDKLVENILRYKEEASRQLKLLEKAGKPNHAIVPHPDDIELDCENRRIVFNGPVTLEQKMAQDFAMSNRAKLACESPGELRVLASDIRFVRMAQRMTRQLRSVAGMVQRRASKDNSWDNATLQERTQFLKKHIWPVIGAMLPPALAQSELCFKAAMRDYLKIDLTKEEDRQLMMEVRKAL